MLKKAIFLLFSLAPGLLLHGAWLRGLLHGAPPRDVARGRHRPPRDPSRPRRFPWSPIRVAREWEPWPGPWNQAPRGARLPVRRLGFAPIGRHRPMAVAADLHETRPPGDPRRCYASSCDDGFCRYGTVRPEEWRSHVSKGGGRFRRQGRASPSRGACGECGEARRRGAPGEAGYLASRSSGFTPVMSVTTSQAMPCSRIRRAVSNALRRAASSTARFSILTRSLGLGMVAR